MSSVSPWSLPHGGFAGGTEGSYYGMGMKKKRGRPRKQKGEGFVPPGTTQQSIGSGTKRKSHRKKAMHFDL